MNFIRRLKTKMSSNSQKATTKNDTRMSTYVINLALELLFELAEMVALVLLGLQVLLRLS